jgi:hypothetical protein
MKATTNRTRSRNGRRQPSSLLAALAIALAVPVASGAALTLHGGGPATAQATTLSSATPDCARCTLIAPQDGSAALS